MKSIASVVVIASAPAESKHSLVDGIRQAEKRNGPAKFESRTASCVHGQGRLAVLTVIRPVTP